MQFVGDDLTTYQVDFHEENDKVTPEIVPVGDLVSGRFKSVDFETGLVLLLVTCGDVSLSLN